MKTILTRRSFVQIAGLGFAACVRASPAAPAAPMPVPRKGVVPAALTPFDTELRVDLKEFRQHIDSLCAVPGVTAIMVNGAAGQDSVLSRDERRALVAEAVAAAGKRTPIIAALRETEAMTLEEVAKDAAAEGAHAVILMPPPDKNNAAGERARARLERVADSTDLLIVIYQAGYTTETLTELASVPKVFAIKEGSGSPAVFERNMRSVRALGRDVAIWSTHSRWLLADLVVGADGILSGMGSVAADLHVALAKAVWRSDLDAARRVNDRLFPLTQVFYREGGDPHTRMKYSLTRLGRWKSDTVRPPLAKLNDAERTQIDRALSDSGLLARSR